jgi:hypothetical protein
MKSGLRCAAAAAMAFFAAAFFIAAPVLAQESPELKDEIKKAIGKKWKVIEPCIKLFETAHPDNESFVIRFELEPGGKIDEVSTQPSDEEASQCFESALWTMEFPEVTEVVQHKFRIELKEKTEAIAPEKAPPPETVPQPPEEKTPPPPPEEKTQPIVEKKAPGHVPVGQGALYMVGGKVVGNFKVKSWIIGQGEPESTALARKSRGLMGGGWALRVTGAIFGIGGAFFLSFGINEYANADFPGHPKDWAAAFTATGAVMFVSGIVFEIVGSVLIPRSWPYLSEAIKAYNASDPEEPIYPAGT